MTLASTAFIVLFGLVVMNTVFIHSDESSKEIVVITFRPFKIALGHGAPGVFLFRFFNSVRIQEVIDKHASLQTILRRLIVMSKVSFIATTS